MSDFIKVNLKSGYDIVANKSSISLVDGIGGQIFVQYMNGELNAIQQLLLTPIGSDDINEIQYKRELLQDHILSQEITREEYDRLCKELGVE